MIILLLLISCRQERAVSPRLVELDSLIAVAPDSAAAQLAAIPADSLINPENRAYHALLTTQAKYKAD
ncbi:MAG: tetratricopeptide repeat protein, partial [Muribaculaceae bacterium]|nr:tetratricopeptide repeat protein [Muribaculaceae bacterium]